MQNLILVRHGQSEHHLNGMTGGWTDLPQTEPALDWIPYPEAESWRMLYRRVAAFHDGLEAQGRDDCIVVSHANAMICLINHVLGLTSDEILTALMYALRPCSLTHLRADPDGGRHVLRLNDVSHLMSTGGW